MRDKLLCLTGGILLGGGATGLTLYNTAIQTDKATITELEEKIQTDKATITELEETIQTKETKIQELEDTITELVMTNTNNEATIKENKLTIAASSHDVSLLVKLNDSEKQTVLEEAYENLNLFVVKQLETTGVSVEPAKKNDVLVKAVSEGNLEFVNYLTPQDIDINQSYTMTKSLLKAAADNSHLEIVRYLLERYLYQISNTIIENQSDGRSDYDAMDKNAFLIKYKFTQTIYSIATNTFDHTGRNNDYEETDCHGITPLTYAIVCNRVDYVKTLVVDRHVDINSKDANGLTPLMYACIFNNYQTVDCLVTNADQKLDSLDTNYNDKYTALDFAQIGLYQAIVNYLIGKGAKQSNSS